MPNYPHNPRVITLAFGDGSSATGEDRRTDPEVVWLEDQEGSEGALVRLSVPTQDLANYLTVFD